jgi:hypothetical protein
MLDLLSQYLQTKEEEETCSLWLTKGSIKLIKIRLRLECYWEFSVGIKPVISWLIGTPKREIIENEIFCDERTFSQEINPSIKKKRNWRRKGWKPSIESNEFRRLIS